jgi:hypothetical protein
MKVMMRVDYCFLHTRAFSGLAGISGSGDALGVYSAFPNFCLLRPIFDAVTLSIWWRALDKIARLDSPEAGYF